MAEDDSFWYKDAIFYQLHVKCFFDSNDDGIGDFRGLMQKLDYIQHLGVNTIWLLPFYPSPLKDDGYDIADYKAINPAYGTMRDFRTFVREAHRRGLRVMTELVVNHTSDQHPWFQRARRARRGSRWRDYYVWSDTDQKYAGTRIIFTDTEKSNWAWDPVAQQYYWHRFFAHQPDLNFDNPRVRREIINVMRFWMDTGVDGMRLDAVPYLCEREGTINENLPETHAVLKELRRALDREYHNRVFLAEANQWPEDVLPYFGENGDECHMAFHFPLMPRMFMAVAREDRHPITDIMRQTPEIPESCQWAIFLRNHDELTLEMVTDKERDYLWNTYASDPRARINVGIRRRLAPLMENDRRKIELLNSLLFSMPGTPIVYYGDELGMGDNIFLGDRNGVRTPMQWSLDRNGGFSRADPACLYLPPNMDPVYGYQAVNAEAQMRSPSSLFNWMRRLIAVRQSRRVFGRGGLRFLYPSNRKILAYLREYEGEAVLCVVNLARSAQGVELDLAEFKGRVPVELTGQSAFPPIGDLPYFLTMPGYSFYWFLLAAEEEAPAWHEEFPVQLEEWITLVMNNGWASFLAGPARRMLERDILPRFLPNQRWYADKDAAVRSTELLRSAELRAGDRSWLLSLIAVRLDDRERLYFLPLAGAWDAEGEDMLQSAAAHCLGRLRRGPRMGTLCDAVVDPTFAVALVEGIRREAAFPGSDGGIVCRNTRKLAEIELSAQPQVVRSGVEQSNTSITIDGKVILKLLRRPEEGVNAEIEVGRYLTESTRFANTPPLLGWIKAVDSGGREIALATLHGFVQNQGDAWTWVTGYLERFLDETSVLPLPDAMARVEEGLHQDNLVFMRQLGRRTAEMHLALCQETADAAFAPEPVVDDDVVAWRERARRQAADALAAVRGLDSAEADSLRVRADELDAVIHSLPPVGADILRTRVHGDYHLGQVLVVSNDVFIIDFEGEPRRTLAERRQKDSPLRDVAGMLRSFDYAAWTVVQRLDTFRPGAGEQAAPLVRDWRERAGRAFMETYMETARECAFMPQEEEDLRRLLALFLIEKACYEIAYEAGNRPGWVNIPLRGLLELLDRETGEHGESE